ARQFTRIEFSGLIKNRSLRGLSQQEIRNAMTKAGLREAHNAHFIMRLVARGPDCGINTLDDLANALNDGLTQAGEQMGTTDVILRNGRAKHSRRIRHVHEHSALRTHAFSAPNVRELFIRPGPDEKFRLRRWTGDS